MKICPIREGIRRKLWKGSGTGSTQLVSGILLLFIRKLNNTLWVLKCRNMQERIACKCAFRLKWRNAQFSTSLSEGNDVRWIFQMLKWQRNGKGTTQSERGRKKRAWRTGCCCSSRFSRELEPESGRGTAAGDWYVCGGSGGSAGAGITLQAGKGLWRWWRGLEVQGLGFCLMAVCSVHVWIHTHTFSSSSTAVHTFILPLTED